MGSGILVSSLGYNLFLLWCITVQWNNLLFGLAGAAGLIWEFRRLVLVLRQG